MSRAFGSPGKYIQKRGELRRIGAHVEPLGQRALVLIDGAIFDRLKPLLIESLDERTTVFHSFGGECTRAEIERLTRAVRSASADVLVAVGGGKTIDAGKAAAVNTGARMVIVPTIASTDAPCSAVAVIYSERGIMEEAVMLPRNPDVVVVDPEVIVAAPVRYLVSGMGDALSTWYEARSNIDSRTNNLVAGGYPRALAGIAIAKLCHEILMRDALPAKAAAEKGLCTPAVENIIEVNTLLSGLGFENCGCSSAHGIHDGLTKLEESRAFLHGEKVAFGTLCLLVLEGRDSSEIESAIKFCRSLGLPSTLADLMIVENVEAKVTKVAEAAMAVPGSLIYRTPVELSIELVRDSILGLDAFARVIT